jgi:hypothetical protein
VGELTRRDLLRRAGAIAAGGVAMAAAPGLQSSLLPRALAGVSPGHCGWGAYVDPRGRDTEVAIQEFEALIGRKLDITRHYIRWNGDVANGPITWSAAGGRTPLVDLSTHKRGGEWIKWADIAAGRYDAELREKAHALRDLDRKVYFVFQHEPENDTLAGNAAEYKAAFNHARNLFDDEGATKLRWVATLMRGTYQGARGGPKAWVPSGAHLLGVDGYNRGACNPLIGWQSFRDIFVAARFYANNHGRKLFVQEFGSVGQEACGDHNKLSRSQWLYDAAETIRGWPEIEAVVYSNTKAVYNGQKLTFRVETSAQSLRAYREIGHRAYFN